MNESCRAVVPRPGFSVGLRRGCGEEREPRKKALQAGVLPTALPALREIGTGTMSSAETTTPARRRTGGAKRPRAKEEDDEIGESWADCKPLRPWTSSRPPRPLAEAGAGLLHLDRGTGGNSLPAGSWKAHGGEAGRWQRGKRFGTDPTDAPGIDGAGAGPRGVAPVPRFNSLRLSPLCRSHNPPFVPPPQKRRRATGRRPGLRRKNQR